MTLNQDPEDLDTAPWEAPFWQAHDVADQQMVESGAPVGLPDLKSDTADLSIRPRLHVLCALYAHSRQLDQRLSLLEGLEAVVQQIAQARAVDLLEKGWRPTDQRAA
jgi:hypothetical protein